MQCAENESEQKAFSPIISSYQIPAFDFSFCEIPMIDISFSEILDLFFEVFNSKKSFFDSSGLREKGSFDEVISQPNGMSKSVLYVSEMLPVFVIVNSIFFSYPIHSYLLTLSFQSRKQVFL